MRNLLRLKGKKIAVINKRRKEKKELTSLNPKKIRPLPSVFTTYAEVLYKLGLPIDLSAEIPLKKPEISTNDIAKIGIKNVSTAIGFAPFAAHLPKVLPLEKSKELIQAINLKFNREMLLFGGGEKEINQLEELAKDFSNVKVVAGKVSFSTELALIANLSLMISMDSGNGHLAAMFQKPVISIWGATHPFAGFTPFNQPKENQFTPDLEKFPLLPTSIYGNKVIEGYENCMYSISIESIIKRLEQILPNE